MARAGAAGTTRGRREEARHCAGWIGGARPASHRGGRGRAVRPGGGANRPRGCPNGGMDVGGRAGDEHRPLRGDDDGPDHLRVAADSDWCIPAGRCDLGGQHVARRHAGGRHVRAHRAQRGGRRAIDSGAGRRDVCGAHGGGWAAHGRRYFGTDGWQYILCDTNCDPNEDIQWYNYFYNQTYYACNDYCNLQSWLPYYYCYEWNTEIFPDGIDECETFCECRCEVG